MGTCYTAFLEARIPLRHEPAPALAEPTWVCVARFDLGKAYELAWGGDWSAEWDDLADVGPDTHAARLMSVTSLQAMTTLEAQNLSLNIPGPELPGAIAAALTELARELEGDELIERELQYLALAAAVSALQARRAALEFRLLVSEC